MLTTFSLLFVPHSTNKTFFILVASFLLSVGSFLTGPSKVFDLPDKLYVAWIGITAAGAGKGLIMSFFWGYSLKLGAAKFPDYEEEVSRKVSIMVTYAYGLG